MLGKSRRAPPINRIGTGEQSVEHRQSIGPSIYSGFYSTCYKRQKLLLEAAVMKGLGLHRLN